MNLPGTVQLHIDRASVPVDVEDLTAALWVAAEHGALNPDRVNPAEESAENLARATVLYILLTQHTSIVDARGQLAAVPPGTPLAELADQARAYAVALFTLPDPRWDLDTDDAGGVW